MNFYKWPFAGFKTLDYNYFDVFFFVLAASSGSKELKSNIYNGVTTKHSWTIEYFDNGIPFAVEDGYKIIVIKRLQHFEHDLIVI